MCVVEICNEKVEESKAKQNETKEACIRQRQSEIDQLKHEHVLDKRKAIEQALQLSRQQRQAEQSAQQKTGQQKQFPMQQLENWQQKLNERWQRKLAGISQQQKTEQQVEQQPANHQQQKKQFNEQLLRQVPVHRKSDVLPGARQQLHEKQIARMSLQLHRKPELQQSLQNKADQQHLRQVPQHLVQSTQKAANEQAQIVSQRPYQEPLEQPEEQKPQEPLVFQVPAPVHAGDYKQSIGEQRAERDVQNLQPNQKQLLADINRQQQFEQLQQDKIHEPVQSQKGLWLFCCRTNPVVNW